MTPSSPSLLALWVHMYRRVAVLKKNGQRCDTSFFACSGCSGMFLNDTKFNRLHLIAIRCALNFLT